MATRKLRVRVTRTFNRYAAGSELIVEETPDVAAEVKAGLLEVIAVEESPKPKAKTKSKKKDD